MTIQKSSHQLVIGKFLMLRKFKTKNVKMKSCLRPRLKFTDGLTNSGRREVLVSSIFLRTKKAEAEESIFKSNN